MTLMGDMVRHREDDRITLQPHGHRCCPTARCSWRAATLPGDAEDSAELYDPETGSWTAIANMQATGHMYGDRRRCCRMARCSWSARRRRRQSDEFYDPAT